MQETSVPESTSAVALMVFKVCNREISCMGILIDFRDEDTRTGETVVMDHHQGTVENI